MPRYQLNPPPLQPRQSGALGQVGNLALQKGLQYGINAAIPGGGFAAEAAGLVGNQYLPRFEEGGKVKPWWKRAADYAWGTGREGEKARNFMQGKADHKMGGGMIHGYQEGGDVGGSKWDQLMKQWAALKAATEAADFGGDLDRISGGLQNKAQQQQVARAFAPLGAAAFRAGGGGVGSAPLGGGQTKDALLQARQVGALTQEEFLKAMAHGGHLNFGGSVAGVKYKATGGDVTKEAEVKFHGPLKPSSGE